MLQEHHVCLADILPRFINQLRGYQVIGSLDNNNRVIVLCYGNGRGTAVFTRQHLHIGGINVVFL